MQQLAEALPITVSENIDLRAKENAPYMNRDAQQGPAPADAASGRWYAVLASYQAGSADNVAKHYQSLEPLIGKLGVPATLEVHYTSISRHLAIVLAPNSGEEADARQLVCMVRKYGWAPDAFVQMSRGWRRCADPVSESTLASCPPAAAR
jgi:hypothetical protein